MAARSIYRVDNSGESFCLGLDGISEPKEIFGTHSPIMYIGPFLVQFVL